jgi:hypothetical protein
MTAASERPILFEERKRDRKESLRRGEGLYDFYDSCARHGYDEFRSLINGWLAEMPAEHSGELVTRMRSGGDREFGAGVCELSVHAFLIRSGCKIMVHPEIPGSKKCPDFAATDQDGKIIAYVEVTTVNPPTQQEAEEKRESPIYNAIDGVALPAGCALGYRLVRAGKNSPALKPLVAEIEQWARKNEEAAKSGR